MKWVVDINELDPWLKHEGLLLLLKVSINLNDINVARDLSKFFSSLRLLPNLLNNELIVTTIVKPVMAVIGTSIFST